ncbi:XRE family transcriptional regulator [Micromonospora sp. LOL_015]|uniref:XRE family transcriptional regulator n=1 Tax=Micromonospora sp. LOL_015 TaxID=3345416 RepID=UPI003A872470
MLDYFHTLLEQHFTADKMLGPRQLLGPVLAQIQVLDELRRHTRPGTTEPTLRLLAQYAEFAGWLHQDAGDTAAAMWWSHRASEWAQAVGDYQMVAYMLIRKSNIALADADPVGVVDLAAAARKVPGPVSPKLHALAAQQEARGWALCRDADTFQDRLGLAAELLREHPDDVNEDAPVYLHHYNLATLEEQSASGYRACGQAEIAVAILERQIAATRAHLHRDTGSARISAELHTLDRILTHRWPTLPAAVELHEALATAWPHGCSPPPSADALAGRSERRGALVRRCVTAGGPGLRRCPGVVRVSVGSSPCRRSAARRRRRR